MKINNNRELQNIAINDSADINYKDCTKIPYSFLTIGTKLSASDPLIFRENLLPSYKMTVTDQLKTIDNKIKENQAQYHLDRLAGKISDTFLVM